MASTHLPLSQKARPSLTQANRACGRLSIFSQPWMGAQAPAIKSILRARHPEGF